MRNKRFLNSNVSPITTLLLLAFVVSGIATVVFLARSLDERRHSRPNFNEDEPLYLSGTAARRLTLAFNGLAADWYWMRSLQYVGKKIMSVPEGVVLDDLGELDLKLLPPLLDTATTLDPNFIEPYEYAALVLPSVDLNEAIRITNKGIAANPGVWRLYQHLGYIYWQQRDYKTASKTYAKGVKIPGAPPWMEAMSAKMAADGGSRSIAREIYQRMYEQANEETVREMARRRLLQLESLDQRDVLHGLIELFQKRTGRCPTSWGELGPALSGLKWQTDRASAPLDPSGTPYVLNKENCDITIDPRSLVPRQ